MLMLTLDIGSTCLKAQVFDEKGNILFYRAAECALAEFDGTQTADINAITETVALLTREAAKVGEICSVAISSFGESFVALDENDSILYAPMLYTDKRGEREAEILSEMFDKDKLFSVTGTLPAAMYSISKLLWLKNNRSEIFRRTKKIMLICDYIGYLLTGKRAIDYGLATRTGCFDIRNKVFSQEILNNLEMDVSLFSEPMPTGSIVGEVTPEAEKRFGLAAGCKLILGSTTRSAPRSAREQFPTARLLTEWVRWSASPQSSSALPTICNLPKWDTALSPFRADNTALTCSITRPIFW